jgi:hypothetical protein
VQDDVLPFVVSLKEKNNKSFEEDDVILPFVVFK